MRTLKYQVTPSSELQVDPEFAYEKQRATIFKNNNYGSDDYSSSSNSEAYSNHTLREAHNKVVADLGSHKTKCERFCKILKALSVILTLIATIHIIGSFFAVFFLSLKSIPFLKYAGWLIGEILASVLLMAYSLNIAGLSAVTAMNKIELLLKMCIGLGSAHMIVMIVIASVFNIHDILQNALKLKEAMNNKEQYESSVSSIMLMLFYSLTIIKVIIYGTISGLLFKLRYQIKYIKSLEDDLGISGTIKIHEPAPKGLYKI